MNRSHLFKQKLRFRDEQVAEIIRIWLKNPVYENGHLQARKFYEQQIKGKYPINFDGIKNLLRGNTCRRVFDIVMQELINTDEPIDLPITTT